MFLVCVCVYVCVCVCVCVAVMTGAGRGGKKEVGRFLLMMRQPLATIGGTEGDTSGTIRAMRQTLQVYAGAGARVLAPMLAYILVHNLYFVLLCLTIVLSYSVFCLVVQFKYFHRIVMANI